MLSKDLLLMVKRGCHLSNFASPMQDIYWLLICSLVLQKQIFLGNQTTLSLELVVTAIVSHIVMLCVCKWTVSGGCKPNF